MSQNSESPQKAKVMAILKELNTKGSLKNSAIETVKTAAVGLAGAGVGMICGKPSLLLGLGTTIAGHYFKSGKLTSFGVGLMASGGYAVSDNLKGTDMNPLEKAKEKMKVFGQNLKQGLYIDKFIKTGNSTNGLGAVQYFKYPNNELDMRAMNSLEDEIARSSAQMEKRQMSGTQQDMFDEEDNKIF